MIVVHRSNRMELLAGRLADVVARPAGGSSRAETIVVQGRGMERWLARELARRFGVWANPDFPFPRRIAARAVEAFLGADAAVGAAFEPEALSWSVAALLRELADHAALAPVRRYLGGGGGDPVRRIELAHRIALVLDRAVVHRPRVVLAWERGADADDWRAVLWRALVARHGATHLAARAVALLAAVGRSSQPPERFPARVSVFGVSSLPPLYVEILAAIGKMVEVHLFLLDPSREYWAEVRSPRAIDRVVARGGDEGELHLFVGNPLLASFGKLGADFHRIVTGTLEGDEAPEAWSDPLAEGGATMLRVLQSDVLHLRHRRPGSEEAPPHRLGAGDDSVTVHSCHGPMREVEVLHDRLVALFEADRTLAPRDVVVMSPAIDAYAPFVEAVFGADVSVRPRIPYSIADRRADAGDEVADAFVRVLDVLVGRMRASQVLDLLNLRAVRARFGIEAEDLERLRRWVAESGVRWAVDAEHRREAGQPAAALNTWRFGLDRLLLGTALPGEGRVLWGGVLPYDGVEGSRAALVGRLAEFCETLFRLRRSLLVPRTLAGWRDELGHLLDATVAAERRNAHQHRRLRSILGTLVDRASAAGFEEALPLAAARAQIDRVLEGEASTRGFLAGGVSFCALVPMRSIPFRVVCLLGMSDGAFPRVRRPPAFDLVAADPRPGDRSERDDDRQLFLESILSARDRLLVTYVGQGIRDDAELPPSVVVSELLDVIDESFETENGRPRDVVLLRHPLQSFSPRSFGADGDARRFSYARTSHRGAVALAGERRARGAFASAPLPSDDAGAVALDDLVRFFRNPARAFATRLGLHLGDDATVVRDREPLELDALEEWGLGNDLVDRALRDEPLERAFEAVRASGALPPGTLGECLYREVRTTVAAIAAAASRLATGGRLAPLEIDVEVGGVRVTGVLRELWPNGQLRCQYSKLGGHQELAIWIHHLALCLVAPDGCERRTTLVGRSPSGGGAGRIAFEPVEDPAALLAELLRLRRLGLGVPLPFFPRSARAYADELARGETAALDKARQTYEGAPHLFGEKDDVYVRLLFAEPLDPLAPGPRASGGAPSFADLARAVFGPLLAHRREAP